MLFLSYTVYRINAVRTHIPPRTRFQEQAIGSPAPLRRLSHSRANFNCDDKICRERTNHRASLLETLRRSLRRPPRNPINHGGRGQRDPWIRQMQMFRDSRGPGNARTRNLGISEKSQESIPRDIPESTKVFLST
jgi:hypothetical protein